MSDFIWNETELSHLGRDFLREVLAKMNKDTNIEVRFGVTGEGKRPNYMVTMTDGSEHPYKGTNHEADTNIEKYSDNRLSKKFKYSEIKNAYHAAPGNEKTPSWARK